MFAALVTGKAQLEMVEFPEPTPSRGKSVVDIAYCGICGTDVHAYLSGAPYTPAICGHEWAGTVSAVGEGTPFKEGDRVAIGIATPCGDCSTCRRGDAEHCERAFAGLVGVGPLAAPHGGFAPRIAVEAARLYRLDDRIGDRDAAMLEPAAVAIHAVRRAGIRLGDVVVVIGGGPIGQLVAQCARVAGAGRVFVVEPEPRRRAMAGELGADVVIDPRNESTTDVLKNHIGSDTADVVFECAGVPQTIDEAVGLARRGGRVSLVGVPSKPAEIAAARWLVQEIELSTSLGYRREEFDIAQALVIDGRLQLTPMLTSVVPLDDIHSAFERLVSKPEEVKILVDPRG